MIYSWLNTHLQRKERREFIKSEPIPESQEKLYSLTEPGKKERRESSEKSTIRAELFNFPTSQLDALFWSS